MKEQNLESVVDSFKQSPTVENWNSLVQAKQAGSHKLETSHVDELLDTMETLASQQDSNQEPGPFGLWQLMAVTKKIGDSAFDVVQGYHFHDAYETIEVYLRELLTCIDDEPIRHWNDLALRTGLFLEIKEDRFREVDLGGDRPSSDVTQWMEWTSNPPALKDSKKKGDQKPLNFQEYSGFEYSNLPSHDEEGWLKRDTKLDNPDSHTTCLVFEGNQESLELYDTVVVQDGLLKRTILHVWDSMYVSIFEQTFRPISLQSIED